MANDLVALVLDLEARLVDVTTATAAGKPELVVLVDPTPEHWDAALALERPVILLSGTPLADQDVTEAILRGAEAVVHAESHPDLLLEAVRVVARGGTLLDARQTRALAQAARPRVAGVGRPDLTERERQILASIARGDAVKQTAIALGISPKTVESLQGRLFCKLGVRNRVQAVARAHQLGLLARGGL